MDRSATIPPAVEELARGLMPHPVVVTVGGKMGAAAAVRQARLFSLKYIIII